MLARRDRVAFVMAVVPLMLSEGAGAELLGLLFAVGVALLPFAPETRGRDLEG